MRAMLLDRFTDVATDARPLLAAEVPRPVPGPREVLVRVTACGVCHTELDEIEGRTAPPHLPVIPGHQIIGRVEAVGERVPDRAAGMRVGVAWIFSACGRCPYCRDGRENLCMEFRATGRDAHGGYADYVVAPADFTLPIPDALGDIEAAPLLCAGAVGYRALRLTGLRDGQRLGLTGFGSSAHLVLKAVLAQYPSTEVYVFARSESERAFARELGAVWAGHTTESSPLLLDAIIDTTPAWLPVVEALRNLVPGGRLVINAIRKEAADQASLMRLDYAAHLWNEKQIQSVANVTRRDVGEFLALAAAIPIRPEVQTYPLTAANQALAELKAGHNRGAKVLVAD
jgi:propanol-preferring alcohol dehydrogenase